MQPTVTKPDISYRAAFLRMLDDYGVHDPINGEWYGAARGDFAAYVQSQLDEENGMNLPAGYVPCSHRWLLSPEGEVAGVVRIRHNISTELLATVAGHIGYDVPPSQRGHGYGTDCLNAGLAEARRIGLERVLVCCDDNNSPSWRIIERCGGTLESKRNAKISHGLTAYDCIVRRYWIDVLP